jgi:hypothetical protein
MYERDEGATDPRVLILAPGDNVAVARSPIPAGTDLDVMGARVTVRCRIEIGHKFAFKPVAAGERIVKYRTPIGRATRDIAAGEAVHLHNVASDYLPTYTLDAGHEFEESRE